MDRGATIAALKARLEREPGVIAAWLFGSVSRGTSRVDRDVDVAVLTGEAATGTIDDLRLDLAANLTAALGREVDLVILDRAPADLVHRVLRDGVLLLERDRSARIRFEVDARNRYFDMTPIWRDSVSTGDVEAHHGRLDDAEAENLARRDERSAARSALVSSERSSAAA